MIEVGVLKNFDSGTYKAGVQLAGSLTTYFDDISVAKNIPSSALVIGNYVILAIPGGNPRDACVIAAWPQGSPGANKLNDIGDVSVASPAADDLFYYDAATSLWKARKLVDADIPAAIARDTEVTAAVAAEATARDAAIAAIVLDDLADVSVASPTDTYILYWDAGTSLWKAKAFPGYKKVTSAVTYNIGSGQDYATVAAAAADLRSLLLEADVTLKLMENVTETSLVEIKGQVSMGGALRIELNGKTWTLSGDLYPKVFVGGLANVVFQTQDAAGGTIDIQHPSPAGKYPFQIRQMGYIRLTWLGHISVDFNNLAFAGFLQFLDNSSGYSHSNVNFLNSGNLVNVARMSLLSRFTFNWAFPGPWLIDGGGMVIDQNGDIWTSKGKVT